MAPRSFTIPDPPPPPTSLANLITSNEAPSDGESSLASAYIDELEPHIALLDEALAFLSRRHAALLASLNAHKSIVSPIRRLPPELLGEIFSFSVHATYSLRGVSGPPCRRAPWLLAHVCSRWAAVALASPVLWTMVSLDLDRLKAAEDGAVSMTNVWLERSKDLPMTLRIFHYKDELDFPFVVDTLIAQSRRWENAYISTINSALSPQLRRISGCLPSLTTLTIDIQPFDDLGDDARNIFAEAPRLAALCAHFTDAPHMPYPFNFPWHQLTRLSTTFTSNTEALSTLRELSNVVECSLRYEDEDAIPENTTIIRLPHLRSLTIEWETVEDNPSQIRAEYSLLKYLETPHLGKLNTQNTADAAAVLALLMRSGCAESLTFFHFHLPSIPEHDSIIQLIQSMPRLVELQIGDLNGTLTEFFDVFSSQWRRAQERSGPPRPTLYAQLVDCMHPGDMSPELPLLREDGLFVEVSSVSNYRSVIMDCFN